MSTSNNDTYSKSFTDTDRRTVIKRLAAIGLTGPAAIAALRIGEVSAEHAFVGSEEFDKTISAILETARPKNLQKYTTFDIKPGDLPWQGIGVEVKKGQQVTVLLTGRWWLVKELDVWVEPGLAFFIRAGDQNPIFNPQANTGTFTTEHSGGLSIARAIGEWKDKHAESVATPEEIYTQAEGSIRGVALVWDGEPLEGLEKMQATGDVGGLIDAEITRIKTQAPTPAGWYPMYLTGNPGIYTACSDGQICCHTHKNACLLKTDVTLPLMPDAKLDWRWIAEELPSSKSEDQLLTHDYLSIAVEFDDGQDLTYMWSADLPEGHVFRCPIPAWAPIETHMVVRSGVNNLGQWFDETRNVYEDYKNHIGGDATKIVSVWLIALSFFQRGTGLARNADINIQSGEKKIALS